MHSEVLPPEDLGRPSIIFAAMIAFLTGTFATKTPSYVYVDVNGVGYEVQISLNTYSGIQDLEKGTLLTHLIVREDAHILFGFFEPAEKEMFLLLIAIPVLVLPRPVSCFPQ